MENDALPYCWVLATKVDYNFKTTFIFNDNLKVLM